LNNKVDVDQINYLLYQVSQPSRYVGNEWNAIIKEHQQVSLKLALAFPDLYEVGMSNLGLQILYHIVNQKKDFVAERVFAPGTDLEELLRREKISLFSLETFTPLQEFDLVGFSLQYELNYTNLLNMLNLSGIPLRSSQRVEGPLIMGGGGCAFNPEPLAPFLDILVLGDGEEIILDIMKRMQKAKERGASRKEILIELAGLEGIYVPSLYEPKYESRLFTGIEPLDPQAKLPVNKVTVDDLNEVPYPSAPIVPYKQVVHDRGVLEISRGCAKGCRFCQAGVTYRPRRHRTVENLKQLAVSLIQNTGYDELSLASLSSSDYPSIGQLVRELSAEIPGWVNLSLPSLRLDSFSVQLAAEVQKKHKTSLTFAPEAGTERLRKVINKKISEDEFLEALDHAFAAGWRMIKLYYMVGLPTETDEDIEAIGDMVRKVIDLYRRGGYREKLKLSVSASTFSPKAHTPFQWEPQISRQEMRRRQKLLAKALQKMKQVDFKWHDPFTSCLEAAFSRGDRLLADVLETAWQKGCRFDNWTEYLAMEKWEEAFAEHGFSVEEYACHRFDHGDPLPWEHLSCGLSKEFFIKEHQKPQGAL